jgi:hypothetical protein
MKHHFVRNPHRLRKGGSHERPFRSPLSVVGRAYGQRPDFKPGRTDDSLKAPDEVAA